MVSEVNKNEKAKAENEVAIRFPYQETLMSLDIIGVLAQHRQTFLPEEISAKADSVCRYGLFEPILVVAFKKESAQDYIDLTNQHYKTNHSLAELTRLSDGTFPVLLSGEVRLRGHKEAWELGCPTCRERFGQEESGLCYRRHFSPKKAKKMIEVKLYDDMPAIIAIDIQLTGNSYTPPPENEMVAAISFQFLVKKKIDSSLTITRFARSVGRSPGTISGYLKVFELPEEIYEFYQKGYISYGIALELAFLKNHGESNSGLKWWAMRAITGKIKSDIFRKKVREHLQNQGQGLLEIFHDVSEKEARRRAIRETVAKEMVDDIYRGTAYWQKVLGLFREGKLGKKDSPFSEGSPVALYRKQVNLMESQVLTHLEQFLPKRALADIKKTIALVRTELEKLEEQQENK